ncbi:response regulator receiver protein [Rippkaea orientalis PCC 8801]|uniref:Response regulator receiver protein n=1 Tax=Rippkaea orientalis (strain PCC 8801 / RF-1) TaxID=41431 RepID=B7K2S6_RIPO1|nr:response regulator [Rippkaea orientalis]ACK67627.1 response regulator receiver protein [Rippkaea orientalis PCC 8801]
MKTPKILIIDDEPSILAVVQVSLEILGNWEVLTASTGKDGLEQAKSQQPDIILLDVMMPDLDGLTVLKELRADPMTQNLGVILLTGKGQLLNEADYYSLKITGIIPKPFDPLTLVEKITILSS